MIARGGELDIHALNKDQCLDEYKLPGITELLVMKMGKLLQHDDISSISFQGISLIFVDDLGESDCLKTVD